MRPVVSVPVLSKTRCVAQASASMARPLVTMTPWRESAFTQAVRATGVASDSAQGQVTTRVDTATQRAFDGSIHHQASAPSAASSHDGDHEVARDPVGHEGPARLLRGGPFHLAADHVERGLAGGAVDAGGNGRGEVDAAGEDAYRPAAFGTG